MEQYRVYLALDGSYKEENKHYCHSLVQCCDMIDQHIDNNVYFKAIIIKEIYSGEGYRTDEIIKCAMHSQKERYYQWRDEMRAKKKVKTYNNK